MHGILPEHLGIERPVLHQLRGQLHEIALDLRESAVLHVVEQEVERMPELVEQRLGLVEGQQRGIAPAGRVKLQTTDTTGATRFPSS